MAKQMEVEWDVKKTTEEKPPASNHNRNKSLRFLVFSLVSLSLSFFFSLFPPLPLSVSLSVCLSVSLSLSLSISWLSNELLWPSWKCTIYHGALSAGMLDVVCIQPTPRCQNAPLCVFFLLLPCLPLCLG